MQHRRQSGDPAHKSFDRTVVKQYGAPLRFLQIHSTLIMKPIIIKIFFAATMLVSTGCTTLAGSAGVDWSKMHPGDQPNYEDARAQAKEAITRRLKDPDSAKFRDSTPFFKTLYNFGLGSVGNPEPLWALCIEVNAKNSYGGYGGFENWLVKFRNGRVINDELGVMHAEYDCNKGPSEFARLTK